MRKAEEKNSLKENSICLISLHKKKTFKIKIISEVQISKFIFDIGKFLLKDIVWKLFSRKVHVTVFALFLLKFSTPVVHRGFKQNKAMYFLNYVSRQGK